ncbi:MULTISPECIES: AsmA family protein [Sphingomonas]|uniref:AsmA family protein n=1 Tax=Sphingomonas TaxID=13687 RepID=UPI001F3CA6EF|nr:MULTISPECIES: AsmA family protein [Sphingomonas]MDY0968752.1 AsmA family protein [Sphingomonas sp. CFBP9021]USR00506.1 AsmA family protein [Sphingomonas aerolata]
MKITGIVVAGVLVLGLIVLAAFPWGSLKGVIQRQLTARFGRPVTIGGIERVDTFGFNPTIRITDVRIPQAEWAGTGDFVRLREAEATFSGLALLKGAFGPRDVKARGLRLVLVRDRNGRTNWERPGKPKGGGSSTDLDGLTISDSVIAYRDDKQDRFVTARFTADPVRGIRAAGNGTIRGAAVRIAVAGPSVERFRGKPWPFTASIDGDALSITAKGRMDHPLDTDAMELDVTARATDLKLIDAVIEAGLFRTQPVSFSAHVRHDQPKWTVTQLKGVVGRSDFTGHVSVDKQDGRTKVDGAIVSRRFDFGDLASDEGKAKGAALERAIGPRLVPNTRIDIGKIDTTDARMAFRIKRIVSAKGASPILSARGVLAIDHQLLTLSDLDARLPHGRVEGKLTVDQRGDRKVPMVNINLRLRGSSVQDLAGGGGEFSGNVSARARLRGPGTTIRAAVGNANGTIGFVARDGQLPQGIAAALGFDAARALLAKDGERAGLRCVVLKLDVTRGHGRIDPMIVDTTASLLRGQGSVVFPGETLNIRLTGTPKQHALLRVPGSAYMTGTIERPAVTIPPEVKSVGNIFKAIGRAITGKQGPTARDADCSGLAARVLR